jgi:enoyl-CoA hydratase/carnithine racemase
VFGKLGIVPEACSSWFLPRLVGISQALDWVYSARILEAQEVKSAGLVAGGASGRQLLEAAQRLAASYVEGRSGCRSPDAPDDVPQHAAPSPEDAHRIESLAMFYTSRDDGHEGVEAFLQKRAPGFTRTASQDMPPFYPWWPR